MKKSTITKAEYIDVSNGFLLQSAGWIKYSSKWFWVFIHECDDYEIETPKTDFHFSIINAAHEYDKFTNLDIFIPHFVLYSSREKCVNSSIHLLSNSKRAGAAKSKANEYMRHNSLSII